MNKWIVIATTALFCGACSNPSSRPAIGAGIQLSGCENFGGNFAVPFDQAQAALPDGFEPLSTTGGRNVGAVFFVIAVRCDQALLAGRNLGPAQLAYAELPATPPEQFLNPDFADYTVPLLFTATPDALADAFVDLRFGQVGRGDITWLDQADGGTQVQFTIGDASVTLSGNVPPEPASTLGAGQFGLFGVQNGAVLQSVRGVAGEAISARGPVTLSNSGGPALLDAAQRAANGFVSLDFSLGFFAE